MKCLVFQTYLGDRRALWDRCTASVAAYAERVGADYHCQRRPLLWIAPLQSRRSVNALRLGYLPILEKANAFTFLGDYQRVCVIDADVWISPDAPSIFDAMVPGTDFAGVVERELPLLPAYARKLDSYERGQYGPLRNVGLPFFNCGVELWSEQVRRLCPEPPAQFLRRPEFARFINGEGAWRWQTEQTLKNWWLRDAGATLQHLDPRFNWLFGMVHRGREREGWFHHFLLSSHLPDRSPEELLDDAHARARI